ncbi:MULTISPECIES: hypothetical protein [unclassified Bradyrhizobium]|uniref:hypothetical protein n=1 Tax=unclassified Bradyrhizobium TaxID=2631580 RepID=UPI002916FE7A|nr:MULTISPECIES: hypothetical protein [unclassified Bradyrhizobium]
MIRSSGIALATILALSLAAEAAFAQSVPALDTPAQPAPAASPTPTATPAPAASAEKPGDAKPASEAAAPKKKRTRTTSTRKEVEDSLRSGTVPSRYRSRVPKEYQKYIPFHR